MSEIIKLENLTKKYSKFVALDSLNLTIQEKGICVGFLGPNGAGKSTTIPLILIVKKNLEPKIGHYNPTSHPIRTNGGSW